MDKKHLVVNTLVFDDLINKGIYQIDLLDKIHGLGISKVEIRREYLRDTNELSELKKKAERLGIQLYYSVPDILFEGELLEKDTLLKYFNEYTALGAKQLKIVAGYLDELTKKDGETLKSLLDEYGIHHLTLENDQSSYSSPEKLKLLITKLEDKGIQAGITFDTGNFLITGQNPVKSAKALKDVVTFIHMKNIDASTHEMTLLEEGAVPMFEVLDVFSDDVDRAIEYPCGNEPFKVLEKEIEKLLK